MEQQHQKFVSVSYVLLAGLIAFISFAAMMKLSTTFDLESKVKSIEYIIRVTSVLIGAGLFFGLYRSQQVNTFMGEVATELLTKVTWPQNNETMIATGVVLVTVVIASLILGLFDWLWALALKAVL